jgi:chaperonin GroEL
MTTLPGATGAGRKNLPGFRTPSRAVPLVRQPAIVMQPQTYNDLKSGVALIAALIRPTLGPRPRMMALERFTRTEAPELLDDGAMIARRIIEITPRGHDVGAMLLRHALWRMHQEAGDGSTTMAVMYQVILEEGIRAITQGGCNAMLLRAGLQKGLRAVQERLQQEALPLAGKEHIARFAQGLVQENSELARIMGEIFDIVGPEGLIVVEKGNRVGLEREYIEGTYWHLSGWFSRLFVTDLAASSGRLQATFEDAAILISDLSIRHPSQLVPMLERCVKAGVRNLVIIAKEMSDSAIGLLVTNNQAKTIHTLAVRTPRVLEMDRVAAMEDIAVLTGGRVFYAAAYPDFGDFQIADLGGARRAWATQSLFGLFGGKGDPRRIRQHILNLRGMLKLAEDEHEKEKLQERLGRMAGGTAILRVGEASDAATGALKTMALRAVTALRNAMAGGVVPGGGAALLHAQRALAATPPHPIPPQTGEGVGKGGGIQGGWDEVVAYRILSRAMEEPMRTIIMNAGWQPDGIIGKVKTASKDHGFDARSGQIADMRQIGVVDSVLILQKALEIAVSGAAQALTTDVIVHHRKPQECVEP